MNYEKSQLRELFQQKFDRSAWTDFLMNFFCASLRTTPEPLGETETEQGFYLGNATYDSFGIGFFHYKINEGSVAHKRVGLRNLVKQFINPNYGDFDAAIVVFDDGKQWRLSFICDIKTEQTNPRRFTFVFGDSENLYRTPIIRFAELQEKGISFEHLKTAFSVEALSDDFFRRFTDQYKKFVTEITGTEFKDGVEVAKRDAEPAEYFQSAFEGDSKAVRDFVKKMQGRIVFLHFLQKKGWLCGDRNFMQNLFRNQTDEVKADFLEKVLEPLFFGVLNTKPEDRHQFFEDKKYNLDLCEAWKTVPYLNGGLFENDKADNQTVRFKTETWQEFFDTLAEYNFTIDENDPDDMEVGVDPEMLGRIFESQLEDNKAKGAFYTPKEIVQYMCAESLIAYLEASLPSIANLAAFVKNPHAEYHFTETERNAILEKLRAVKICDPAIGSGAFPMGMLNLLYNCRRALGDAERNPQGHTIRRQIVEQNIYGVDIERGAVDIARLRFWLALIVEETEPEPLPNFDYKFMQGNSLLESFQGVDLSQLVARKKVERRDQGLEVTLFENNVDLVRKELHDKITHYFNCTDHTQKALLAQQITDNINAQMQELALPPFPKDLDLKANTQFFLWHTWFADVFQNGGFDIVIGNPPYGANIDNLVKTFAKLYPDTSHGFKDIYKYFFDFSLKILNSKGNLCFITPNTFLRQPRYGDLRRLLLKYRIEKIIDFGEIVFEAVVPTAVSLITKNNSENVFFADLTKMPDVPTALANINFTEIKQSDYQATPNNIFVEFIQKKSEDICFLEDVLELKDCGFKYQRSNVGMAQKGKNDLADRIFYIGNLQNENDIPILIGKDIYSYYYSRNPEKKLRANYNDLLRENEGTYYNKKIMAAEKKLIWRQTAPFFIGTILSEPIFFGNTIQAGIIKPEFENRISYEYLLGLLNSKYLRYLYEQNVKESGRVFPQVKLEKLKPLPIKIATSSQQRPIISLVEAILSAKRVDSQADTAALEAEIDRLVYALYGLSAEEVKVVEGCKNNL